ncbi:MAG: AtpZ/AtpI family protein [Bacteroidetes bacterium]|nr:AtpZ/AtpI family protein [Bacteroidota bacterium]MCH8523452.1 AtpZ/AtpI family protein [Balneolales bacterium]
MAPNSGLGQYGDYLGLGIQIAASMVMPLLLGVWLDKRYGSSPWFTLAGALFGIFSIFGIVLKIAFTANNQSSQRNKDRARKK